MSGNNKRKSPPKDTGTETAAAYTSSPSTKRQRLGEVNYYDDDDDEIVSPENVVMTVDSPMLQDDTPDYDEDSYKNNIELMNKVTEMGEILSNNIDKIDNPEFRGIMDGVRKIIDEYLQELVLKNDSMEESYRETLRRNFQQNIDNHINNSILGLPIQQQAQAYQDILDAINNSLTKPDVIGLVQSGKMSKSDIVALAESISKLYDSASQQLAGALDNLSQSREMIAIRTVSLVTLSAMLYTYQPLTIRTAYEGIPYFGSVFRFMNSANNILQITSNSAITTTGMYYFLRNAGVPVERAVESVKEMATSVLKNYPLSELQKATSNIAQITGEKISELMPNLMNGFITGDKISKLMSDVQTGLITAPMYDSQESQLSQDSQDSQLSQLSQLSRLSQQSVHELLEINSINSNKTLTPEEEATNNAILVALKKGLEDGEVNEILIGTGGDSEDLVRGVSVSSNITADSHVSGFVWQYGTEKSTGGKRMRKSRRVVRLRRTRKVRRARKGKMTKKGKKKNKTLKRYKNKFRR